MKGHNSVVTPIIFESIAMMMRELILVKFLCQDISLFLFEMVCFKTTTEKKKFYNDNPVVNFKDNNNEYSNGNNNDNNNNTNNNNKAQSSETKTSLELLTILNALRLSTATPMVPSSTSGLWSNRNNFG